MFNFEKYDKAEKKATERLAQGEDSEEDEDQPSKVKRKSGSLSAKSGVGSTTYVEYRQ